MNEKKKVLMLASVASMIDQFNMSNIRLMLNLGYEVHVACNFTEGNTCDAHRINKLQQKLRSMHVVWHQWDCPRSIRSIRKCRRAYRQLWNLTQEHHYEWMHCHSPVGGALARIVAHRQEIRVIYTAHGFHFYRGAPLRNWLLYYPAEKLLAYWTDVLVTINREDYSFAKKYLGAAKITYIPGVGIDTQINAQTCGRSEIRRNFRRRYRIPENAIFLLSVGELSRRKNHQLVLSVLAQLSRKDVYYLICGQGVLRETLIRDAARYGVAGRIRLPGFLENVAEAYLSADIFVFPSLQEGMPVALMEAMAAGLPCVVSDIRGSRELVTDADMRFGIRHLQELKQILDRLTADNGLRQVYGHHNQNQIRNYDTVHVEKKMKSIYASFTACHVSGTKQPVPEISVIMSVFNTADEQILGASIGSIQNQTFTDWELIICDDGSTDGTWEMLQRIAGSDPRIRLIRSEKNRKAGYARNRCIRQSCGRYIAVMDADDISAPQRLERQYQYLEQHPYTAFVGSRGEFFIRETGDDGELYWYCRQPKAEDFLFSLPYVHASIMFRRAGLFAVHGYDSAGYAVRTEDYDLLLRLYASGRYGYNLEEVLYYIRRDEKQYRRRKYKYRFHEAFVKCRGFRKLGLMPVGAVYAAKPLIVGLFPRRLTAAMQKRYYRSRQEQ